MRILININEVRNAKKQKALSAIHEDRFYVNNPVDERRLTVNWLFAESKGEVK